MKKILIILALVIVCFIISYKLTGLDILKNETSINDLTQEEKKELKEELLKDSVPEGIVPIIDFSCEDSVRIMDSFYKALAESKNMDRPIRIAYFGDSFIGGDIVSADLRELLQKDFGGQGAGAVDLVQLYSRATVIQKSNGLVNHLPTKREDFKFNLQSMNNIYATSDAIASATQIGTKTDHGTFTEKWSNSFLYFRPVNGTTVKCKIDGMDAKEVYSGKSDKIQMVKVEGETHSVEWSFTGKGNVFYFASNEGKNGIVLDNFGIVSVQGTHLKTIPQSTLEEFAAVRPYDLIIMQYGLNVASPDNNNNYKQYARGMKEVIENFHKAWPEASLLLVSVSDRCKKNQNGQPATTMKGIKELVSVQRDIAKDSKIAYWDMFTAMGGDGAIGRLAAEGNAEKDYIHLNPKGGKIIAKSFYDAISNAIFNYNRRMKILEEYTK